MADDTTEQYVLDISAQDNASATVNQVNAALTQTLAQTQQLTLANNQAAASVKSIADQMVAAGASAQEIFDATGEQITAGLTAPADAADSSVQNLIHDIGDLGDAVQSLPLRDAGGRFISIPDPELSAFGIDDSGIGDSGGGGGGDSGGGFNISGSRRGLTALGSLAGGSPGLSEAARLVSVTAAFGPFGLALGAGAIALKSVTDAETARTKAAQDGADALNKIAQGAAGGTTESINKQIEQQTQYKQNLEDAGKQLASYNDEVNSTAEAYKNGLISQDEYTSVLQQIGTDVSNLTGGAVDAGTAVSNMTGLIADNQKSVDGVSVSLGGLHIQLNSSAVAINDAAEKAHKLALSQEADADRALSIDQLTKTQRDERYASDEREVNVLTRLVGAGDLNSESLANVAGRIDTLNADMKDLNGVSESYADTVEREKEAVQALTDANQKTLDLLTQESSVRDKIANTEADIQQIREDAAAQQQADLTDEQSKIAEIQQSGAEKQQEILTNNEEAKQKIQRQFALDDQTAIGNRDAYADEQARKKEALDLTNQQVSETKQLTAEAAAEQKSITQAQAAYEKSLTQQEQAEAKELAAKDRTLQQEQVDLQNILNGEIAITNSMFSQLETIYITHAQNIVNGQHALLDGAGNAAVLVPAPSSAGVAYPQAPLPAVTGTAAQSHQHITVNVNGLVSDTAAAIVINHTMRQLDAMM